jgi:zinc transporter, ZIP family
MVLVDVTLGALVVLVATSIGSSVVLCIRCINDFLYSALLAFCGGVMAFSVMEMFLQSRTSSGDIVSLLGLITGAIFLSLLDKILPHLHATIRKHELVAPKKKAALLAGAIALHNVPEGFAIASAFASSAQLGWLVTITIALQDIPEGLIVSAPLACYGMTTRRAVGFGILSGLVEAAAAILGYFALTLIRTLVPLALSFSAGAMLYVILVEMAPDAFKKGYERAAAFWLLAGFGGAFLLGRLTP